MARRVLRVKSESVVICNFKCLLKTEGLFKVIYAVTFTVNYTIQETVQDRNVATTFH